MSGSALAHLLSIETLVSAAAHLAAGAALTDAERQITGQHQQRVDAGLVNRIRDEIVNGSDPLGSAYCLIRSPEQRRGGGQTFTPLHVIEGMFGWAEKQGRDIHRIVDPGAGTGRYVLFGLRRMRQACAVAVERDPVLALLLRANAAVLKLEDRLQVDIADYRDISLTKCEGPTLFIGNPPYVRHHGIEPERKRWYTERLRELGYTGSQLAGLHLHFFLKTLDLAKEGDLGCFVTAAEWLDVNYGKTLRDLLTNGLGGRSVHVVDPSLQVFGDALVSAAITCFEPHSQQRSVAFQQIDSETGLRTLGTGRAVERGEAKREKTWSILVRNGVREKPSGHVELGELFKVHRGQVTGLNRVWVHGSHAPRLPHRFLYPSITDARDITQARGEAITDAQTLRGVVDLPELLDGLSDTDRENVETFLTWAKQQGADATYIAEHRNPWWKVRLKDPAPIVVTYMGRRPPVFARNLAQARLINVAHGLYPRVPVSRSHAKGLVHWLNQNVSQDSGRVYAGGLTKFEPSEVMRLMIPSEQQLLSGDHARAHA
jgi:adenine-specific DNA-methyltransferase